MFWPALVIIVSLRLSAISQVSQCHNHHMIFQQAPQLTPQTATSQFSVLNCFPTSVLVRVCSHRFSSARSLHLLYLFMLLAGDIELNPGPPFSICTLNIRSLVHPLHKAALFDLASSNYPNVFAITETWVRSTTTFSDLMDATPPGYSLISKPRDSDSTNVGGGLAFLVREPFTSLCSPSFIFPLLSVFLSRFSCIQQNSLSLTYIDHHPPQNTQALSTLFSHSSIHSSHLWHQHLMIT